MNRTYVALITALLLLLAGCRTGGGRPPVSVPAATPDGSTPVAAEPPPPPVAAAPPCTGPNRTGPPSVTITVMQARIPVPLRGCAIGLPAGPVTLSFQVGNVEPGRTVSVTGADGGRWEGHAYHVELQLNQGQTRQVTVWLEPFGGSGTATFALTGEAPIPEFLASAPTSQGPWTPVPESGLIAANHGWLRISYPRPMKAEQPTPVRPDRYDVAGLPGRWQGDRLQYVQIPQAVNILYVGQASDANGLELSWQAPAVLYRGVPPELQRVAPTTGTASTIHQFGEVPFTAVYRDGAVAYAAYTLHWGDGDYQQIDLATGRRTTVPAPIWPHPSRDRLMRFPSPDGKLEAQLYFPDGPPGSALDQRRWTADLTILERATGKQLVHHPAWLTSFGSHSCAGHVPAFAWRPDSGAVAAIDAPERERLVLKVADLTGASRAVAERRGPGLLYDQHDSEVAWAPSGKLILFGPQLVELESGKVLAERLGRYPYWSSDSKHLLLHTPDHPFTIWGKVELLDAATGRRTDLGHGLGLGWTPTGEALLIRWDLSREIPPPGKGCP